MCNITISDLIKAYELEGHNVEGFFIMKNQRLGDDEIYNILLEAKGRDIVVNKPGEGIYDGES